MTPRSAPADAKTVLVVLGSLALALPYALLVVGSTDPHVNLDDSFITLVYARNLAETGSFFYNAGEDPVDGFTSFLDVVVKAAALTVWPDTPYRAAVVVDRIYHATLLTVCAFAVWGFTRGSRWRSICCGVAALLFASSWDLAEGVASELEAPLYALLGVCAVVCLPLGDRTRTATHAVWGLCVFALPLARPEGLAISLLLLVAYAVANPRRSSLWIPLLCVGGLLAFYAWRISTFGYWAPNTYYAKTSDSRVSELLDGLAFLWGYAGRSTLDAAKLLALCAAPVLLLRNGWPDATTRIRFGIATGCALVSLASIAFSGGDSYLDSRRLLALPMTLALLLPFQLIPHGDVVARRTGLVALVVMSLAFVPSGVGKAARSVRALSEGKPVVFLFPTDCARDLCQRLAALAPDGAISHSDFQLVKFFAPEQRVIDLEGLNDRQIAHQPQSGSVLYGKYSQEIGIRTRAEIYVYGSRRWTQTPMARHSLRQILSDPKLLWRYTGFGVSDDWPEQEKLTPAQIDALVDLYRPASMRGCDAFFNFLIRKDIAPRAAGRGVLVGPSG